MVHNPLIRHFLGGGIGGVGPLNSHDSFQNRSIRPAISKGGKRETSPGISRGT